MKKNNSIWDKTAVEQINLNRRNFKFQRFSEEKYVAQIFDNRKPLKIGVSSKGPGRFT